MASKRIARSAVDWAKFEKLVPKPDAAEFQHFKTRSTTYVARLASLPESLPAIDWAQYKRRTKAFAGVVADFEKKYAALSVPAPTTPGDVLEKISKQEQEEVQHQKKFAASAEEQVKKWEEDLKKWNNMPPVIHMTNSELVEYLPDIMIDHRKQPSIFPHDEEVNNPESIAQTKNYVVHLPEDH